jgi:hypothetical protein
MLHPRLSSVDGSQTAWLAQIGPYGAWSDLNVTTRWGQGASGMFEASWSMPLPAGFEHPLLRRGTIVELMDGPWRVGSPLLMSDPGRGLGLDQPWTVTATGVGREAEGQDSYYALDGSGDIAIALDVAVDAAIARGLPWDGRDSTVLAFGPAAADIQTLGAYFASTADYLSQRWGVWQDSKVGFRADPTGPTYQVVPGASALSTADDSYASTVLLRYNSSDTSALETATATNPDTEARYGHREALVDLSSGNYGAMSATTAQAVADGILAKSKGRLSWANGLTLTSNELLTMSGVPASLSKVLEDVGAGCMVRLHGVWDDLLATTGNTYLDVTLGEAKYVDGAPTIDLNPLGLAPRDLAAVVESVTGMASAA